MKLTIEITDEQLDELATRIASKVKVAPSAAGAEAEDDLLGDEPEPEPEPEVTLKDVMDKIRSLDKSKKDAVLAIFKKHKVSKATELTPEQCPAVMEALNKIK